MHQTCWGTRQFLELPLVGAPNPEVSARAVSQFYPKLFRESCSNYYITSGLRCRPLLSHPFEPTPITSTTTTTTTATLLLRCIHCCLKARQGHPVRRARAPQAVRNRSTARLSTAHPSKARLHPRLCVCESILRTATARRAYTECDACSTFQRSRGGAQYEVETILCHRLSTSGNQIAAAWSRRRGRILQREEVQGWVWSRYCAASRSTYRKGWAREHTLCCPNYCFKSRKVENNRKTRIPRAGGVASESRIHTHHAKNAGVCFRPSLSEEDAEHGRRQGTLDRQQRAAQLTPDP